MCEFRGTVYEVTKIHDPQVIFTWTVHRVVDFIRYL